MSCSVNPTFFPSTIPLVMKFCTALHTLHLKPGMLPKNAKRFCFIHFIETNGSLSQMDKITARFNMGRAAINSYGFKGEDADEVVDTPVIYGCIKASSISFYV